MMPVLFSIGPVSIYGFGVMLLFAVVLGMFVAWKKVESYHVEESKYFDVVIEILIWALIGGRVVYVVGHYSDFGLNIVRWLWLTHYVGLSFWGALVGLVIALTLRVKSLSQDIWKWLDLVSLGLCQGLVWGKVGVFLSGGEQIWPYLPLVEALVFAGLSVWLFWLDQEYRTIAWYRAGKTYSQTGFLWFWFLGWLGVIQLLFEFGKAQSGGLGWLSVNRLLGISVLLVGVVGLYVRSGRSLKQDWIKFKEGFAKKRRSV